MPPMTGLAGEYFVAPPGGAEAVGDASLMVVSSNRISSSSWSLFTYVNVESWLRGVDNSSSLLCMEAVLMASEGP